MKKRWILALSLFCPWALSNTLYTIQASFDVETTTTYEYQVLKLALKNTTDEYGQFQLNVTPTPVPTTRYLIEANSDNIHNFIFVDSVNKEKLAELAYAKFPVLLGIIGYRVSLVSQDLKQRGYTIANKADLMNIAMVQGKGWLDGDILTDNGFTLHTGKNTEGLFYMVANERAHFFPIGANQIDSALNTLAMCPV
ncbi:hypothetical protein [Algibacillus agarilyticus]|uniref:hypothetical protein n=1 Tax=Algibacillus agarilyticus TaxID=2234133 RepID=UPI000DD04D01|nr:hypothetical protein [Algibacillus agarilyticus]